MKQPARSKEAIAADQAERDRIVAEGLAGYIPKFNWEDYDEDPRFFGARFVDALAESLRKVRVYLASNEAVIPYVADLRKAVQADYDAFPTLTHEAQAAWASAYMDAKSKVCVLPPDDARRLRDKILTAKRSKQVDMKRKIYNGLGEKELDSKTSIALPRETLMRLVSLVNFREENSIARNGHLRASTSTLQDVVADLINAEYVAVRRKEPTLHLIDNYELNENRKVRLAAKRIAQAEAKKSAAIEKADIKFRKVTGKSYRADTVNAE